jgi:FKBP-type peptidyl-prolyl cis-trans isomerase 2
MTITEGDSVTIEYVGRLDDGRVFDTSDEELAREEGIDEEYSERRFEPLTVTVGDDRVITGLQEALIGMAEGETGTITIPPAKAYGEHSEGRVASYDRAEFEEMIGDRELDIGFEVETEDGLPGEVVDIDPGEVTVDFNHELAGETLEFELEILEVD